MRFVPTQGGLQPFDRAAREFMASLRNAEPLEMEALHDRDMVHHRRIMATISDVAKALGRDFENVRAELLFKTGNFKPVGEMFGKAFIAVNHMDRRHMTDHELSEFWSEAQQIIASDLLPHITDPAERERIAGSLLLEET
jgi:hypothetical protein